MRERGGSPARTDLTAENVTSVFSSRQREGRWDVSDEIEARAIFGEVKLDLSEAELPPSGVVEIEVLALFGEVQITVPEGADVEIDCTPVFGAIERKIRSRGMGRRRRDAVSGDEPAGEPPLICIDGQAIFGNIKIVGR